MRSVGIDIGSYSIKVCVLDQNSKGVTLSQYFEKPILSSNKFDRDLEVIEFLRDQLPKFDITQTKIVCGLRQDRVSLRYKNFPFKDRNKIVKSLPFELEEDIPFSADETIFDGRIIKLMGNTSDIMAVAAPKDAVKHQLQLLTDSGLEVQFMTPEGCALGNLLEDWQVPPPQFPEKLTEENEPGPVQACEVLVHFGHQRTLVIFYNANQVLETRSILWGSEKIIKSVSETYGISPGEAEKQIQSSAFLLLDYTGATQDQIGYSELIGKCLKPLLRDLRLTILEFKAANNFEVTQVLFSGGVSRIKNINAFATQGIEVAVNRFDPFQKIPYSLVDKSESFRSASPVAIGLAIEGLRRPKNPAINLLRGEFARQSNATKLLWNKWGTTVKYVGLSLIALYVYSSFRESSALDMADAATEVLKSQSQAVAGLKGSKANESNIKRFIKEKKKIASEVKSLVGLTSMNSALELLKKVSDTIPARNVTNVELAAFEVMDSKVSMQGYVNNASELNSLSQSLKNLAGSSKHRPFSPNIPAKNGKVSFAFDFEVDRNISKREK